MTRTFSRLIFPLGFVSLTALNGCLVVPMRTNTVTLNTQGVRDKLPKQAFVQGKATREQVEEKLKAFKVQSDLPDVYWGRFAKSSWSILWIIGGYGGVAGGGADLWGSHNLFIDYALDGTVADTKSFQDKELNAFLIAWLKTHPQPPVDLAEPVALSITSRYNGRWESTSLYLGKDTLTLEILGAKQGKVDIPLKDLKRVKPGICAEANCGVSNIIQDVRFNSKTPYGTKLTLVVEPRQLVTLVRYLEQVKPEALK